LFPEPLDIPRNALNSAASSLRWNRANGQLPFSNWRRHFSFKTTVTVLQDWAFQPQTRRKYVTNWAKGLCVICLKKTDKCKQKYYVIAQTMTELCYKVPLWPPHDWVHLDDIKKRVATKKTWHQKFQIFCREWSGFLTFRKHHAPSQCREFLAQWHGVISQKIWIVKETAVITGNPPRMSKSRMSNVSLFYLALLFSLTFRPLYTVWRHSLFGRFCRPWRWSERFEQEIL